MKEQKLPEGWTHERIRGVLNYYENQTDAEAEKEIEAAFMDPTTTFMQVPVEIADEVSVLIGKALDARPKAAMVRESAAGYLSKPKPKKK